MNFFDAAFWEDDRRYGWLVALVLFVSCAVYFPSYPGGFVYDAATSFHSISPSELKFSHAFDPPRRADDYFRPMPTIFGWAIFRVLDVAQPGWETQPDYSTINRFYHVHNYLHHAFVTWLVLLFVQSFFRKSAASRFGALAAASWFGLHPIHTEVVAWWGGQSDLMVTIGLLGSLLCAHRFRGGGSWAWALSSGAAFLFALLTKENAAVLVVFLPLYLWSLERYGTPSAVAGRRWLPLGLSLLGALAVYFALRLAFYNFQAPYSAPQEPVGLLKVLQVFALYLYKTVIPWPLSPYITTAPSPAVALLVLVVAAALLAGAFFWKAYPRQALIPGAVFAGALLVPGLVYVLRPAGTIVATERIIYTPTVGTAVLVGALALVLFERARWRKATMAVLAVVLVGYAWGSLDQSRIYSSNLRFWEAAAKNWGGDRDKYVLVSLGGEYMNAGRFEDARAAFARSLEPESRGTWRPEIRRRFDVGGAFGLLEANRQLAGRDMAQGRLDDALLKLDEALMAVAPFQQSVFSMGNPGWVYSLGLLHHLRAEARTARMGRVDAPSYQAALAYLENAARMGVFTPQAQQAIAQSRLRLGLQ